MKANALLPKLIFVFKSFENFFRKFFLSNQIVKKIKRLEEENRNLKKYITQTKYQNLVSKKKN